MGNNILLAVDNADDLTRTLTYVGETIGAHTGFTIYLFHVLSPMPPELLEFGGSENPNEEETLTKKLREDQSKWITQAKEAAQPLFEKAKAVLQQHHVSPQKIHCEFSTSIHRPDVVRGLLEAAQNFQCGTIVVGRSSFPSFKEMFHAHIGEELVQKGQGFTIWVVE